MSTQAPQRTTPVAKRPATAMEAYQGSYKSLQESYKGLQERFQELGRHSKAIEQAQTYLAERNTLHSHKTELELEVETLKSGRDSLFSSFERRVIEKDTELRSVKKQHEANITSKDAEYDKATKDLRREIRSLKDELEQTRRDLEESSLNTSGLKTELSRVKTGFKEMSHNIGWLPVGNQFEKELRELSRQLQYLSTQFFGREFESSTFEAQDELFKALSKSESFGSISDKIPISNSRSSRLLRAAVVEALIAKDISEEIFQDPQIFLSRDTIVLPISPELDKLNEQQEAILRSLMTTLVSRANPKWKNPRIEKIEENILETVSPLLTAAQERERFRTGLRKILSDAFDLWVRAQQNKGKVHVLSKFTDDDDDDDDDDYDYSGRDAGRKEDHRPWETRHEFDNENNDASTDKVEPAITELDGAFLTVFPRLFVKSTGQLLHPGVVIWYEQKGCVQGMAEAQIQMKRVRRQSSAKSRSKRRSP